jgi:hypothetical protein
MQMLRSHSTSPSGQVYGNFAVATEIHDDSGSRKVYKVFR